MLTIINNKNAAGTVKYFTENLAKDDYFFSGRSIDGRYHGLLKEILGLPDKVSKKTFKALVNNRHPVSGKKLTSRNAHNRKVSTEYTFSAPKSVSVVMALTGDREILRVHRRAVKIAMKQIEKDTNTQVRVNGRNSFINTGNHLYARFDHFTARPVKSKNNDGTPTYISDPQLHSHCLVFNATMIDGKFQAIENSTIRRVAGFYEAVYHSELSRGLQEIGYEIERTNDRYEIKNISRTVIEKFSNRSREIDELAKKLGIIDSKTKASLGAKSRLNKKKGKDNLALKQIWKDRLTPSELRTILKAKKQKVEVNRNINPGLLIQKSLDHHLERRSTIPVKKLWATALKLGYGSTRLKDIKEAFKRNENIVTARRFYLEQCTTREMIRKEDQMIRFAAEGRSTQRPINQNYQPKREYLNKGQRRAIKQILSSPDRVQILSGGAGTGKSTILQELSEGAQKGGKKLFAFAPSAVASRQVLREKGFAGADTISMFLKNKTLQKKVKDQIILIDESGLLGVKTTLEIFKIAKTQNARVIFSGDVSQHTSIEAGDAQRILLDKAGLSNIRMDEIVRQKANPDYKQAIEYLAQENPGKGFAKLESINAIKEIEDLDQRSSYIANQYWNSIKQNRKALIVSPTHYEGELITNAVRQKLKDHDRIKNREYSYTILKNLNLTEVQKSDPAHFDNGLIIQCHQNMKGDFKAGQRLEIKRKTKKGEVYVHHDELGKQIIFPLRDPARFDVFEPKTIKLAQGDKIRITHNGKTVQSSRIYNGQRFEVKGFAKGNIVLSSGRHLDKDFGHLSYGYCSTSHSSQGLDAKDVIIAQSSISFAASNEKQFYVSASRGIETIQIVTDDREGLKAVISKSGDRLSALELEEKSRSKRTLQLTRSEYYNKTKARNYERYKGQYKKEPQKRISKSV